MLDERVLLEGAFYFCPSESRLMAAVMHPVHYSPTATPYDDTMNPAHIESLAAMFPSVDKDVLEAVLIHHHGNIEMSVSTLLDLSGEVDEWMAQDTQEEIDAEMAMRMQEEIDEELAHSLALKLHDQEQRRLRSEPSRVQSAASPGSTIASSAKNIKSILARVRSRRSQTESLGTPLLNGHETEADALGGTPGNRNQRVGMNTRLLDSNSADASEAVSPMLEPLQIPVSSSPLALNESSEAKYNARVDRARAANAAKLGGRGASTQSITHMVHIDSSQFVPATSTSMLNVEAEQSRENGPREGILI